ncbi:MAG: LamG-like jellyroll fold domain-containing protein, partial [Bacteroidales bacterium]
DTLNNFSPSSFSFEAWIFPLDTLTEDHEIYRWGTLRLTYHQVTERIFLNFGEIYIQSRIAVPDSIWTHVAITVSDSMVCLYINGIRDTEVERDGNNPYISVKARYIGAGFSSFHGWTTTTDHFTGYMDEIRTWTVSREPEEIRRDMHYHLTGEEPGLEILYDLHHPEDSLLMNLAGDTYDGEMKGNPTWGPKISPVFDWFALRPFTRQLEAEKTENYTLAFDARNLRPGIYESDLRFTFPGHGTYEVSLPVKMHVLDASSIQVEPDSLAFNHVFLTDTAVMEILVTNTGSQDLLIFSATTESENFRVIPAFAGVDPGENEIFTVSFIPGKEGFYDEHIWFISNDSILDSLSIPVTGTGIYPPVMATRPDTIHVRMKENDSLVSNLFVTNSGLSDLHIHVLQPGYAGNQSLKFNGRDSYITLPPADKVGLINRSFTVEAWIYPEGMYWNDQGILGTDDWGGDNEGLHLCRRNDKAYLGFYFNDLEGKAVIPDGQWTHLAWRYDKTIGEQAIFVNGKLDVSSQGKAPFVGTYGLRIGRFFYENYFWGSIDELRIWDNVRTQEMIAEYMNQELTGAEEGILAYWPFNEGEGQILHDQGPGKHHGVLYGGIAWAQSNAPVSKFLSVDPDSGVCAPGAEISVDLKFSTEFMQVGTYHSSIIVTSNDPLRGDITIPVILEVIPDSLVSDPNISKDQFQLFPNPTNGIMNVLLLSPEQLAIEVRSINGQCLLSSKMVGPTYQIDLSSFTKGIYFITIRSKDFVTTRKIVKL